MARSAGPAWVRNRIRPAARPLRGPAKTRWSHAPAHASRTTWFPVLADAPVPAGHGRGWVWAVGERLNARYQDRALVEVWNGHAWSVADVAQPGSARDMMFGASALSPSDVWVVGDQEGGDNVFETLAEHWNGHTWSVVPTPDPGSTGNHLYAVDAVSPDNVWAVGQQLGRRAPDRGLVEHWDGRRWSVARLPASASASVLLDAVAATRHQVWVAGEADSPGPGGVTAIDGQLWLAGAYTTATSNEIPLIEHR
jgi:hypothetical protein